MGILKDIEAGLNQSDTAIKQILVDKYRSLEYYFGNCRAVWSIKDKCPYFQIEGGVWLGISLKRNLRYYNNDFVDKENFIITIPNWINFRLPACYTKYYKKTGKKTVININVGSYFNNYTVTFEDGTLEREYDNVIVKIYRVDPYVDYQYLNAD